MSKEETAKKIEDLGLSVRITNTLYRVGIHSVTELADIVNNKPEELLKYRGIGIKALLELQKKVNQI